MYDESSQPSVPITRSQLHVTVSTDNNEAPQLAPGSSTSPRVALDMDQTTVIHNGYLRYTDPDTSDRDIIYNITKYVYLLVTSRLQHIFLFYCSPNMLSFKSAGMTLPAYFTIFILVYSAVPFRHNTVR